MPFAYTALTGRPLFDGQVSTKHGLTSSCSITGTPAGIGWGRTPKLTLHRGDEFVVEILPHIGSLVNVMEEEE